MSTIVKRILFMVNAGYGNPHQYALTSPRYSDMPSNFDLFAINVRNESENFVLFARAKKDRADNTVGINNEDMIHIAEYIYEIALKTYAAEDFPGEIILEIDTTSAPGMCSLFHDLRVTNPETAGTYAGTPMTRMFFELSREHARKHGRPINLCLSFRSFSATECHLHFFPECDRYGTDKCCKVRHSGK